MGNENSQPASSATTPASEGHSVYSFGSVRRSSAASSQHSSPVEPPQPDLSHLTEDEIAQIRSVIDRAKQIQVDETNRVRQIEEDYTTYAADIVRKSSWSEIENEGKIMCPICNTTELKLNSDGTRTNQNVCKDCEEITCDECGEYTMSQTTKNRSTYEDEYETGDDPQEPNPNEIETTTSKSEIQPALVGATAGAPLVEPTTSQPPLPPPRRKHKKDDSARKKATPPVKGSEAVRKEAAAHASAAIASKHRRREQVKRAKSVPESDKQEHIQRVASLPGEEEEGEQQRIPPPSAVGPGNAKPEGPPLPPPRRKQPTSLKTPVPSKREERKARKEAEDNVDSSVVFPCQSSAGSSRLRDQAV